MSMNKTNTNSDGFLVVTTVSARDKALGLSREILDKRLAACVNFREVTSQYWWNEEINLSQEYELVFKTDSAHLKELIETIKYLHNYDLPEVIHWPIKATNEYMQWINKSCKGNTFF